MAVSNILEDVGRAFREGISDGYRTAAREAEAARRSTTQWASGLKDITHLVAGGAGVLGIADAFKTLTKSVAEFTTTAITLQSFATDTRLATSQVLQFQQAGSRMGLSINETNKTIGGLSNVLQDLGSRGTVGSAIFQDVAKMGSKATDLLDQTVAKVRSGDMAGAMKHLIGEISKQGADVQFEWSRILGIPISTIQEMQGALSRNVDIWPQNTAAAKALHDRWIDLEAVWKNVSGEVLGKLTEGIVSLADAFGALNIKQEDVANTSSRVFSALAADVKNFIEVLKSAKGDLDSFNEWLGLLGRNPVEAAKQALTAAGSQGVVTYDPSKVGAPIAKGRELAPGMWAGQEPDYGLGGGAAGGKSPWMDWLTKELPKKDLLHELGLTSAARGATDEGGGGINPMARDKLLEKLKLPQGFDAGRFEMTKAIEEGTEKGIVRGLEKVFGAGGGAEMLGAGGGGFQFPAGGAEGMRRGGGRRGGFGGGGRSPLNLTGTGAGHVASKADRVAFIRSEAAKQGLDPDKVVAIAAGEGLGGFSGDPDASGRPTSFGDFQLHVPGVGRNTAGGEGQQAIREGINITDPTQWREQDRFAIRRMKEINERGGARAIQGTWHGAPGWAAQGLANEQKAAEERQRIDKSVAAGKSALGTATIDINVRAPKGTIVDSTADGVFKDINTKRLPQGADAGASNPGGNYSHQSFE